MKKNKRILIIFIFIIVFSISIVKPLSDLDEIWNYNTARAVKEGLTPYKDISMITTPLLPMVVAVFLKIIANQLIVTRILSSVLFTAILYMTYSILEITLSKKRLSLISTFIIGYLFKDIFALDYNFTVLFITLVILYTELKNVLNGLNNLVVNIKKEIFVRIFSRIGYLY